MPGIVGIIGKGFAEQNAAALQKMVACMRHEPFYRVGTHSHADLGLYLGWIHHEGSFDDCLPIWNETKDICLLFTGEDHTDQAEIDSLRSKGHTFAPENAGYLVHLYEERGLDFLQHLNGRFAGFLIDQRNRKMVLFNDRYGLARLYYHENPHGFYFASEAKALLNILPTLRALDLTALADYFSCGCTLQNRTLFKGVELIPGGSAWIFPAAEKIRKESYFDQETWASLPALSCTAYYEKLKETWIHILPRYLRKNESAALSLTGGKDSRMIMAWLQPPPGALPCYTFGSLYREPEDVKLARRVADICQQPHHTIRVGEAFLSQFPTLAERTVYLTDGVMDVSGSADLYVNQIARQIAKVRLTGNYGQEILRGAISFKPMNLDKGIFDPAFAPAIENSVKIYFSELVAPAISFVAFKQVPWHHFSRLALELSQITMRSPYLDNDLVKLSHQLPQELSDSIEPQLWLIAQGHPGIGTIGTDRGSRYHSVPLLTKLNHSFKEFTFKAEYAYDYGMPPWLARFDQAFRKFHLEKAFLGRHKFYHFRVWYRDELSEYVKSILLDPLTLSRPYLNRDYVEKSVNRHIQGVGNHTLEIHRLLSSELIQRQLIALP